MRALRYHILSESEVEQLERTAHNPPSYSDAFTPDDFSREWWAAREALAQRLAIFGDEWQSSTYWGDFMVQESRGDSRWIYITFTSTRLWRPEFAPAVADLLSSFPHDYRVGCLTELNDEELLENPLVYLVISPDTISGTVDDPGGVAFPARYSVLSRLGFPDSCSEK